MELSDRADCAAGKLLSSLLGVGEGRGRGFQGGVTAGMRPSAGQVLSSAAESLGGGANQCRSPAGPAGCYFSAAAFLTGVLCHPPPPATEESGGLLAFCSPLDSPLHLGEPFYVTMRSPPTRE